MDIDFNKAFEEGASEEQLRRILDETFEKERADCEKRLKAAAMEHAKKQEIAADKKSKDDLLREGRAYMINAVLAYTEAFDLLEEGEEWTEEDIKELETAIIKMEKMIPMYVQLLKMQEKFDDEDFFKGLM